ncbi:hypothetical protein BC940DRAFT_46317 [Gongronella butleri]|nr:hypothetical protein BC940DRAFT_46317 [Gongronella butleri]
MDVQQIPVSDTPPPATAVDVPETPAAAVSPGFPSPSHTVRSNWLHYLRQAWRRISRTSRVVISSAFIIGLLQIIVTVAILIIGRYEVCDKPLDVYLMVFVARLGLSLPIMVYQHLRPGGNGAHRRRAHQMYRQQQQEEANGNTSDYAAPNSATHSETPPIDAPTPSAMGSSTSPSRLSETLNQWIDRVKSMLDLIAILWFVVGNYFLFTASDQCHANASHLFYTTMTWILLGYFLVLIPLLLCTAVIFCLPCLLVFLRVVNVDCSTGMVGATQNDINQVPVFRFVPLDVAERSEGAQDASSATMAGGATPSTGSSLPTNDNASFKHATSPARRDWLSRYAFKWTLGRSKHKKTPETDMEDDNSHLGSISYSPADAMCTICLSDYETNDLICKLRCDHHFHRDCVREWLGLNYKCPLCQRDFRKHEDQ